MLFSVQTYKTATFYTACAPELGLISYGGCQDEAVNNLGELMPLLAQPEPPAQRSTTRSPLNAKHLAARGDAPSATTTTLGYGPNYQNQSATGDERRR